MIARYLRMDGLTKVLRMCAKLCCGIGWTELTGFEFSNIGLLK